MKNPVRKLQDISPDKIEPNPENPRLIFRQEEMETLLRSIDRNGIQVPLVVFRGESGYVLIDGERRWRCAKKLNLRKVPALVQDKPTALENLLLMYNIHALREQWDYFTIATNLSRIIDLFEEEKGYTPNEVELSEETGLTRGQIRRCNLLLNLPDRFQDLLFEELELPKANQKLSEDFFIEMEKSLKTVVRRIPDYQEKIDDIREALIEKFRSGAISAVTDFRSLAKIATSVDNLGVAQGQAKQALDRVFDRNSDVGIKDVYEDKFEFQYDEKRAISHINYLLDFFSEYDFEGVRSEIDEALKKRLSELQNILNELLGGERD